MILKESRKINTLRNTRFGIIKYVIQMFLQFVVRSFFIRILGKEYLGLNSIFSSILNMLNFVELGMGSAIVFSMYKPIAENDIETIKSLNNLYKKIYIAIASIVSLIGLLLIPFLKFFITGSTANLDINFTFIYILFLLNSVINYLAANKRSLLFAYQRNDIESKIKTITISLLYLLQLIALIVFKSFYIYVILMPVTTLLDCFFVSYSCKKLLPEINGKSQKLNPVIEKEIKKNVIATSMHQISNTVVTSTDNLLISIIISTAVAGLYSNYYTIIYTITSIFTLLTTTLKGSIGNMLATSDCSFSKTMFDNLNSAFSILTGICTIALICLFQPFITIWTGSSEYQLDFCVVLVLCIHFYLTIMRFVPVMFKDCAGLMWNDRMKPIIEASVNLIASILLAKWLGLIGVFIGSVISTLVAPFWIEPYVLYKNYFKIPVSSYWKKYSFNTFITLIIGLITFGLCLLVPDKNIYTLIIKFGICAIVPTFLFILAYFKTPEFKYFVSLLKNFLSKYKKEHSKMK